MYYMCYQDLLGSIYASQGRSQVSKRGEEERGEAKI